MKKKKDLSLSSQGINYKLKIAFYLMSILPLLVSLYLVSNYILPNVGIKIDIAVSIVVSIFITCAGFFLIKQVIDRILSVSNAAKIIAAGDINHKVEAGFGDEVGDLGSALNQLTSRIRGNMNELQQYSERTSEINLEIQKRVLVFSNLLQISSLISQGAKLDEILKITTEKSRLLASSDLAFLLFRPEGQESFLMKTADGVNSQYLLNITLGPKDGILNRFTEPNKPLLVDKDNELPEKLRTEFYEKFRLINILSLPIYLKGKAIAILGIGNSREKFSYKKDDVELLDIFAKQVAIAVDNDILIHRVEKLEIKDVLTGLYNEAYIRNCLQEEIKRAIAYQRPCAFILLSIDNFQQYHQKFGSLQVESVLKKTAFLIKDSVTEIQRVARFGDDKFAIILPENNKRQALGIIENIRKKIEFTFGEEQNIDKRITVSGSVSENPLDGINAEELISKAQLLLSSIERPKNRIAI